RPVAARGAGRDGVGGADEAPRCRGPAARDVVAGDDVRRAAARLVADADLVHDLAGPAGRRLEGTGAAGAAVEDRPELGKLVDLDEGELAGSEHPKAGRDPEDELVLDPLEWIAEAGDVRDRGVRDGSCLPGPGDHHHS